MTDTPKIVPDWWEPKMPTVDRAQAEQFAQLLFDGMAGHVALRGIASESGPTAPPPYQRWLPIDAALPAALGDYVEMAASNGYAAYLLPHPVRDGGGGQADILAQRVIPIDIDDGDIAAKVAAITGALGEPWLTIESGGEKNGQRKVHLYYRLEADAEPKDFERVRAVRAAIASKFGADTKVGNNPAQILRCPGSEHVKPNQPATPCRLIEVKPDSRVPLDRLEAALGGEAPRAASNVFDLNAYKPTAPAVDDLRNMYVQTEGRSDITRWDWFSRVAGAEIADARAGRKTLDEAEQYMLGAVQRNLENPGDWTDERVAREFAALVRVDIATHGPFAPVMSAAPAGEWANFDCWTADKFADTPPKRSYLIEGILPLGIPALCASAGGLGKSYLMLDLAMRVATGSPTSIFDLNDRSILGGKVCEFGTAVMFTAEDDHITVHERLAALDPSQDRLKDPKRLRIVPLPDAGGARPLFVADRERYKPTAEYEAIRNWLKTLPDLKLVIFDPLQTFVAGDITSKPEAAQFVMSALTALAAELRATILVTHHLKKTERPVATPEEARAAIRGTTALVDGVRWAYALWETEDAKGSGVVAHGAVVKTNGIDDKQRHDYRRLPCGVLRQAPPSFRIAQREELLEVLRRGIAAAAAENRPFTKTGENGLFNQRYRLPEQLRSSSRQVLEAGAEALLANGTIVKGCRRGSTTRNLLDVPGGDFAMGHGMVEPSAAA